MRKPIARLIALLAVCAVCAGAFSACKPPIPPEPDVFTVTVRYVDKATGDEIAPPFELSVTEGGQYDVNMRARKSIEGYVFSSTSPWAAAGIAENDTEIIAYYKSDALPQGVMHTTDDWYVCLEDERVVSRIDRATLERTVLFDGGEPIVQTVPIRYTQYAEQPTERTATRYGVDYWSVSVEGKYMYFASREKLYRADIESGETECLVTVRNDKPVYALLVVNFPISDSEIFYGVFNSAWVDVTASDTDVDSSAAGTAELPVMFYYVLDIETGKTYSLGNSFENRFGADETTRNLYRSWIREQATREAISAYYRSIKG